MAKFLTTVFLSIGFFVAQAQYTYTAQSALASDSWYRIGVTEDGIYAVYPSDLSQLGAGSALPINKIHVYGYGGTMLPEKNGDANPDDMLKNPIKVYDLNGDGIFNGSDYLLFYGKGPSEWIYSTTYKRFEFRRNIYIDTANYFISINNTTPLTLTDLPSQAGSPDYTSDSWDDFLIIENDSINLINSGRRWFWRDFKYVTSHTVSGSIAGGFRPDSMAKVRVTMSAKCINCTSSYSVTVNGQSLGSLSVAAAFPEGNYSVDGEKVFSLATSGSTFNVKIERTSPLGQGIDAWLDFVEINGRRYPNRVGSQLQFTDRYSIGKSLVQYNVGNASGTFIWDITDVRNPKNVVHANGSFALPGDVLHRFIVFEGNNFKRPTLMGKVANQNLHALGYADNLVVTNILFYDQAKRLADYHLNTEGVTYHIVTVEQIYNEFSSGVQDPTGIRNFVRMFWQRYTDGTQPMPKYLTLFGDASYDPKTYLNRSYKDSSGVRINVNSNFVPVWITRDSYSEGGTFSTDDYFGIMGLNKGASNGDYLYDYIKIGIGRLLVRTPAEAEATVSKIIHYASSQNCKADWRNRIMLMADDEDAISPDMTFVPFNEQLSSIMKNQFPVYNVDKLYLDAYDQVVTAGQRYPDAEKALTDKINKGLLLINYIGHGGEKGLTKERLMQTDDIEKWDTYDKLPLWITATCTFTRYDDPHFVSAGEYILMKPDGGGIGLISTSRPISPSSSQSNAFMRAVFTPDSATGEMPRMGDIIRNAKNTPGGSFGSAPLLLLFGDPALRLAYPKNNVITTTITDEDGNPIDTLKATQVVKVTGSVTDTDGFLMSNFNGWIYPTVFDKASKLKTKRNDPVAVEHQFEIQKNILFKGKTKVENGNFEFTFKVPLDINYTYGLGKISYYAEDEGTDAHGFDTLTVGGSENNCQETNPPTIQLYLNDEWFVNGGVANSSPLVYAKLYDESGINLSGAGIGHDLLLTLDGPVNQEYVVNDFFLASAGDYKSGELHYRLRDLPMGEYTLSLRAWDACTNSGTSSISFRVDTTHLILNNLYNFPNPTNAGTTFSFEHNFAEKDLQADLRVYTLQGALVKQIKQTVHSDGFRSVQLQWDCNLDAGGRVAAGLYIYTLYLSNGKGKAVKASNKLIITE